MLTSRMKCILADITPNQQSAFVGGRLITDKFLLFHEALFAMKH